MRQRIAVPHRRLPTAFRLAATKSKISNPKSETNSEPKIQMLQTSPMPLPLRCEVLPAGENMVIFPAETRG